MYIIPRNVILPYSHDQLKMLSRYIKKLFSTFGYTLFLLLPDPFPHAQRAPKKTGRSEHSLWWEQQNIPKLSVV